MLEINKNSLSGDLSPYLLQHKNNPVNWQTWTKEILDYAKNKKKPILLSIGYASCHWCHVMAHESFEDIETSKLMNNKALITVYILNHNYGRYIQKSIRSILNQSFKNFEFPLLIGASRKRFIGEILKEPNPKDRDIGTLAISCLCSQQNIHLVRGHNVKINHQVLKVADHIFR